MAGGGKILHEPDEGMAQRHAVQVRQGSVLLLRGGGLQDAEVGDDEQRDGVGAASGVTLFDKLALSAHETPK